MYRIRVRKDLNSLEDLEASVGTCVLTLWPVCIHNGCIFPSRDIYSLGGLLRWQVNFMEMEDFEEEYDLEDSFI